MVNRKIWVSVLLLVVTFLALTPTSVLTAIYADTVEQVSTCSQMPGIANGPCFTTAGQTGVATDWATVSVSLNPTTPTVGQQVTIDTVIVAVSSPGTFPQNVQVGCFADTTPVGGGIVTYPGPVGTPMTVPIPTPWTATLGTHKLTCGVATIPAGLDPNKINNWDSITFTVGSLPVLTEITGAYTAPYPGVYTSASTSLHTTIIGITGIPSLYIFGFSATLNAPPASPGLIFPGTMDAGKCSNTASCVITIDEAFTPSDGCAEYCNHATIAVSVNFPSSEHGEPVTLTVPNIPAGVQLSWGSELPASSLASYTAMPPFTVNLGVYVTYGADELNGYTPLYGSQFTSIGLIAPKGSNPPPAVISILGDCHDCISPQTLATITLTVNPNLGSGCIVFGTNPDTNPNFLTDCTTTYTYQHP